MKQNFIVPWLEVGSVVEVVGSKVIVAVSMVVVVGIVVVAVGPVEPTGIAGRDSRKISHEREVLMNGWGSSRVTFKTFSSTATFFLLL